MQHQTQIVFEDGYLQLYVPPRRVPDEETRTWTTSHLDDIQFDNPTVPESCTEQKTAFSRRYKVQSRLATQNGALVLGQPLAHVPLHLGKPTSNSTSICFLLSLPGELRLGIYRHLLVSETLPVLCSTPGAGGFRVLAEELYDSDLRIYPQILQTCKRVNQEATQLLYAENIFRRRFYWPSTFGRRGRSKHLPLKESSPISSINLQSITKIRLFRDYTKWLREGRLRVLDEFPLLRELQVHIDMNDAENLTSVWKDTMRAIHRYHRKLPCLRVRMRLAFNQAYKDWCNEYTNRPMGFSLHMRKKTELENWFQSEGIFTRQKIEWRFLIELSAYVGPSATVMFSTGSSQSSGQADGVMCYTAIDGKKTLSTLPM
ncbi:hypothetical protein ACLX1H_000852 [Fusarium chlamydosporum]